MAQGDETQPQDGDDPIYRVRFDLPVRQPFVELSRVQAVEHRIDVQRPHHTLC
jgi:hypothetical protein